MKFIILDSTPLGLLTQRPDAVEAEECRNWLASKTGQGIVVILPEIIDYEIRRELIRARKVSSVQRLDQIILHPSVKFLPITSDAMKLAADYWARARQKGKSTAHERALDVDVILAAQVIAEGFPSGEFIIATSNVKHLSLFAPAAEWLSI